MSAAVISAANELKSAIDSGNAETASVKWKLFKPIVATALALSAKSELSSMEAIRSALESASLLHVRNQDVREFDRCVLLLEPIYLDYAEPILPASSHKPLIISLQLLRLLTAGCIGDFYVKLQKLSTLEKAAPELSFVIDLEQCLMSGNYEKCVANISSPPNAHLQLFCSQLKEAIRNRVATCLQKSHTEVSVSRVKQLLMLDNDVQLKSFIDLMNSKTSKKNHDELMGEETEIEGDPSVSWNLSGDQIKFITIDDRIRNIPVNEVINCMIGYAVELERIV